MTIVMLNDTLIWQVCPQLYGTVVHPLHRVIATIFHHTGPTLHVTICNMSAIMYIVRPVAADIMHMSTFRQLAILVGFQY